MSQVIARRVGYGAAIVVLSGPSFAAKSRAVCRRRLSPRRPIRRRPVVCRRALKGPAFRALRDRRRPGVEFGGALKNVIAIAAGVGRRTGARPQCDGGADHARSGRNSRLASAEGGRRETLAGLSGLGDLVLTCTGRSEPQPPRRHRARARPIARRHPVAMRMVAEGMRTTGAALALGARHGVELPIAAQMAAVLDGHAQTLGPRADDVWCDVLMRTPSSAVAPKTSCSPPQARKRTR